MTVVDLELVSSTARSVGLVDANGALVELDSLMALDLAMALESKIGREIPPTRLTPETFASLESVTRMLQDLLHTPP